MRFRKQSLQLDHNRLMIGSPEPGDAVAMIAYLKTISEETHFMVREVDEVSDHVEAEKRFLTTYLKAPNAFIIAVFKEKKIVAVVTVSSIADYAKVKHRCTVAIGVIKAFQGMGLGKILMQVAMQCAKTCKYEQMELGVFSDNAKARNLYQKLGFMESGTIPDAFKLKDERYLDEIRMYKKLR